MIRTKSILLFILFASLFGKFMILGKGYFSIPDENRHIAAQDAAESLKHGEFKKGLSFIFKADGRPGTVIFGLIPASIQIFIANRLHVPYNGPESAWVMYMYNLFIFGLILFMLYKLCIAFGFSSNLSLCIVLTYSVTINSYIYLRHAFPYDASLLLLIGSLNFALKGIGQISRKTTLMVGSLLMFGLSIYPGYFPLAMAIAIFYAIALTLKFKMRDVFFNLIFAVIGAFGVVLIFELLSRFSGASYIGSLQNLSETITQGAFAESLSFIIRYLFSAELYLGWILLIGLPVGLYIVLFPSEKNSLSNDKNPKVFFIVLLSMFLFYASLGVLFHKMVMYGRLLHQFYPFIAILVGIAIYKYVSEKYIAIPSVVIFGLGLILFVQFKNVEFPKETLYKLKKQFKENTAIREFSEWDSTIYLTGKKCQNQSFSDSATILTLVNFGYPNDFNNLNLHHEFKSDANSKKILSVPHWHMFQPYLLESADALQRKNLKQFPLKMEAYISLK